MALTFNQNGTGGHTTAATSVAISPSAGFTGATTTYGVLAVAYDNAGTLGADPYNGPDAVVDTAGNTWQTSVFHVVNNDPGAASAGCIIRVFVCPQPTTAATDTITLSFSTNVTAKAWTFIRVNTASGFHPQSLGAGTGTAVASTTPTVTTSSIPVGNGVLGVLAYEANTTITGDADTLNGTWAAGATGDANTGTSATSMRCRWQSKVQTTTPSTQTWNPTGATATDWALYWFAFAETADVDATAEPAAIPVTAIVDESAATGDAAAAPAEVAVTAAVDAPAASGDALAVPAAVEVTAAVPEAFATAALDGTATPAAIAVTATVPDVVATGDALAAPAAVPVTATTPEAAAAGTIRVDATATPAPILVTVTLDRPAAGVLGGGGVTLTARPSSGVQTTARPGSTVRTGIRPQSGVTVETS